jgi:AcrR family transcriptional regulator
VARPTGRRNHDFDERKATLAGALSAALIDLGPGASLRDLAAAVGASPSSLRHYFGSRDGVFDAVAAHQRALAAPYFAAVAVPMAPDLRGALTAALGFFRVGWTQFGVDRLHATALAEGLLSGPRGPSYVTHTLEPSLGAFEALLEALAARGDLCPGDARQRALSLVGPVLLALLHQTRLGGDACRPLDVEAFLAAHVDAWIGGHAPPP